MAYNEFAYFYDEFNGEADYDALYSQIHAKLEAHGIHDGIVADLGCGTGELTLMLTQAGYDMIGIDQSEEMLCVVRDKAEQLGLSGRLLLLRQDLLKLDLYGTIRAAVSTFDTFNHIPDLDTAIANAGFFMEKGGVFLFDMNTPYKYREMLGNTTIAENREEGSFIWENEFDEETGINVYDLTLFLPREDGLYERDEEIHYQKAYDPEKVRELLEKAGLIPLAVYDAYTKDVPKPDSGRLTFVAREHGKEIPSEEK